ncbi:MAG: hypothetical protein MI922_00860 [Bacteroidales bacterium]|nr:hypothetical protein [Bacteroidales bacterium]
MIHELQLLKSSCQIDKESDPRELSQIGLEINVLEFNKLDGERVVSEFVCVQTGTEGSEQTEFFTIESHFRMVLNVSNFEFPQEITTNDAKSMIISKVYPYVQLHHTSLMHLMGVKADLPFDLPRHVEIWDEPPEGSKMADVLKKGKKSKTSKSKKKLEKESQ